MMCTGLWAQAEIIQMGDQIGDSPVVIGTDYLIQFDGAYTNLNAGASDPTPGALGEFSAVPSSLDLSALPLVHGTGMVVTLAAAEANPVNYNASLQMKPGSTVTFTFTKPVKLEQAKFSGDTPTNVSWGAQTDVISGGTYDFQGSELAAGDSLTFIAPSASFRLVSLTVETFTPPPPNQVPTFSSDPISAENAFSNLVYRASITDEASDPDLDLLTFSKLSGSSWLTVLPGGSISGTPGAGDVGLNSFTVQVDDGRGGSDTATLEIMVSDLPLDVSVTDRSGSNVIAQGLTDSDHIHIQARSSRTMEFYTYQLLLQSTEPTPAEWGAAPEQEFYQDLYFYREATNQWVQISVSNGLDSFAEVYGVKSFTEELTAPPDDPILPVDYVDGMGIGLIVEADSFRGVWPELDLVEIKKAGFGHIRMHIGRQGQDKASPNTPASDPNYFHNLDAWIVQVARHGMFCHIGNKGNSVLELDQPDDGSAAWDALYHAEHLAWWEDVSAHCKFFSHRLAYHMFLETGGGFMGDADLLNPLYADVTESVRLEDPARILIYTPPSLNDVDKLPLMTFPYPDLDPGDGIATGSGDYFFSDFHQGFAGGRKWVAQVEKEFMDTEIQKAIDWVAANDIPLIMSACRPTCSNGRHDEYFSNRIRYIEHLYSLFDQAKYPIRVTWLTHNNYNFEEGLGWKPGKTVVLEAMNRNAIVDPADPDGDQISTDDELNIYGTNPYLADSDQDNILDTYECTMAIFDPNDPADGDVMGDLGHNADFDGDGMGNAWEMLHAVKWGDDPLTTPHLFDPADPSDALAYADADTLPNIWERVMRINPNNKKSLGATVYDGLVDTDKDGVTNDVEITVGTWPMASKKYDADYDGLTGNIDPMPFINDLGHIAGYTFDGISDGNAPDHSSQGANNVGTLMGDVQTASNAVYLGGQNGFVDIPTTDFGTTSRRAVNLHFRPQTLGGYQVLYKEGSAASGLSLYLDGSTLWAGAWDAEQEQFVEIGTVAVDQWHAATVAFDGADGSLSGYLFQDNARLAATNAAVGFTSVGDATFRTVLGGSDDASRVWDVGGSVALSNQYFKGFIDEVQIYSRELSAVDAALLSRNDLSPFKDLSVADADGDGLPDSAETLLGSNLNSSDSDGDGMPDRFEDDNDPNLNPNDPLDGATDFDSDGMSNGNEYLAGMDYNDPNSLFAITVLDAGRGQSLIQWASVPGRHYRVDYSEDLLMWDVLPGAENILADGAATEMLDNSTTADTCFYRIFVLP